MQEIQWGKEGETFAKIYDRQRGKVSSIIFGNFNQSDDPVFNIYRS